MARQFIIILEEVDLRVEPGHYDVILCEDMGKMDLGLDDVISCEWKSVDFSLRDLVISIFQHELVRVEGVDLPWHDVFFSFLLVISIFLNQFRKKY